MDGLQQQFDSMKTSWDGITTIPPDLTAPGYPGLTKQSIAGALGGMENICQHLEDENFTPLPIPKAHLNDTIVNLSAYTSSHIPSNPLGHIPGFLTLIEQARIPLKHMLEEADNQTRRVYGAMAERLAIATSRISDASQIHSVIVEAQAATADAHVQAENSAQLAETTATKITAVETNINTQQNNINETLGDINETVIQIKEHANAMSKMTSEFEELKTELDANKASQESLFAEFERYRAQAEATLELTNQSGLGASFIARKNELKWSLWIWASIFIISISALALYALTANTPITTPEDILAHLPVSAPIVWLAWFAARQYGFTVRLGEDYAFKAATAMAFEGYKREAAEAGPETQQNLLDTAIYNFGKDPLRIFDGHANHASPAHEILGTLTGNKKPR